MNEKLIKLNTSLEKSEEKVSKIENTISKHFVSLDKKIAKIADLVSVDYSEIKFNCGTMFEFVSQPKYKEIDKLGFTFNTSDKWEDVIKVKSTIDAIYSSYVKLREAKQVVENWESKINKEILESEITKDAPQVIIDFVNKWGEMVFEWTMQNLKNVDEVSIRKTIESDKISKINNLTFKCKKYVGIITDARGLQVSEKGDLVGVIIGTEGSAYLQSVVAGGWNIQCFHFRTLINKIN